MVVIYVPPRGDVTAADRATAMLRRKHPLLVVDSDTEAMPEMCIALSSTPVGTTTNAITSCLLTCHSAAVKLVG
jgi:hypothetical protein